MKRFISTSFCILGLWLITTPGLSQKVDEKLIKKSIEYLASEALGGRLPGTQGDSLAANFIRSEFVKSGIRLLGENGFQRFDIITDIKAGSKSFFFYPNLDLKLFTDFTPVSFSKNDHFIGGSIFVGYGFDIKTDSLIWNDYENKEVKGKWVIILRGEPDLDNPKSKYHDFSSDRQKVLTAKDKGAGGVILVNPVSISRTDDLMKLYSDHNFSDAGIPVLNITRKVANVLIKAQGIKIDSLEKTYNTNKKPLSFELPEKIDASAELILTKVKTYNVLGMIEGSDLLLKNQYIVIGGHYDHLGLGGVGSSSRMPDTVAVHYGADDNASGASGVIALADAYQKLKVKPKRSIIFIAFGAEEEGLLGSSYFVKSPVVDLKNIVSMLNFDMIGRLKSDKPTVSVSGSETALEFKEITSKHTVFNNINIKYSPDGYGPSDHATFFGKKIPVLYFTTGVHTDYHTPLDHPSKINYTGCANVLDFSIELLNDIINLPGNITYNPDNVTYAGTNNRSALKVTFGIIPDYTGASSNGLLVEGVKKDGPAHKGGIEKGDVITAIEGKSVANIYEYMARLQQLEPGKTVTVDIDRNGNKLVLLIKL